MIETQLLFDEGDTFSKRVIDESKRILRQNAYLRDARIEPVVYKGGVVDLRVITKDVWTLSPNISAAIFFR